MKKQNPELILLKEDFELLNAYLADSSGQQLFNPHNREELHDELRKAKLVSKDKFPTDVVRLNSKVRIRIDNKKELLELQLVTPAKANIKEKKISVMAPLGTALIGVKEGEKVKWNVPSGEKLFTILKVVNEASF